MFGNKWTGWLTGQRKRDDKSSEAGRAGSTEYPPDKYTPVLHCSICNGEQVAGFKDKETGRFIEIMVIRNEQDLAAFREKYGVDELKKEY